MTEIATDRLQIRNFRADDWGALYEMIRQYKASGLEAYDHEWPAAQEEYPKIAQWFASGDTYWAVCLKQGGRFIGFVCLNPEQREGRQEYNLGYIFNFDYHGKGYATEACGAVLSHAFEHLGADAVVTGTAAANEASCRLLARLGLRLADRSTGMYALSREEWQQAR